MTNGSSNHYFASSMNYARNRRKNSKGNVIKYLIPGLKNTIEIPFPDRKLPVCKRCKKIYKTRELCRIRDGHTDTPWNISYLCVTLDDSCFVRDSKGNLCLLEDDSMQFVARSLPGPPMPYCAKKGHIGGAKAPICMACKDKNYTRHHCREKQKHQQLPWGTVYVLMSATPCTSENSFARNIDNRTHDSGPNNKRPASSISISSDCSSGQEDGSSSKKMKGDECSTTTSDTSASTSASTEEEVVISDDIRKVESTRAFLMTINKDRSCALRWLEIDPFVPRSEYGASWGNQCQSVDQGPIYQNAPQFNSDTYPPPPPGWSGFSNNVRDREQCYAPDWNGSMGGPPPKMTSNHSSEFNGPPSQPPYSNCEQYNSNFSGMQPNPTNSSYGSNSHGLNHNPNPMYSEDDNRTRRKPNSMHHPMHKNSYPQHQNEGFNRNYPSHLESMSSGPNIQGQYRNREHGGPRQPFSQSPSEHFGHYRNRDHGGPGQSYSPPSQSDNFQYPPRRSLSNRTSQGHHDSLYQSNRHENYPNSRGEEWISGGRPLQLGPMPNCNPSLMLTR